MGLCGRSLVLLLSLVHEVVSNWDIKYLNFSADMTYDSIDELTIMYEIGKDQVFTTELLSKGCQMNVVGVDIIPSIPVRTNKDDIHDYLSVGYSIAKSTLASSNIWDAESKRIEFCHVLQLVQLQDSETVQFWVFQEDRRDFHADVNTTWLLNLGESLGAPRGPRVRVTIPSNMTVGSNGNGNGGPSGGRSLLFCHKRRLRKPNLLWRKQ